MTVAHVSSIREEAVAETADVAATTAEPEVAKKGKGDAEAAPDAKADTKKK
jgi:large subunit ribosomal protein L25